MDFQDYAAKEATAAIGRALAESSEASRQRLQAFRSAINAATKALETALTSTPQIDLTELVSRVAKAASAETDAAVQRARAEANAAAQRTASETKAATEALLAQVKAETKAKDALAADLAEARAQADELRHELQTQKERIEAARSELAAARDAHKKSEAAHAEVVAARDREAAARAAADSEVKTSRASIDDLRSQATAATNALAALKAEKAKLEEGLGVATSATQAAEAKLAAVTGLFQATSTRVKVLEQAEEERETTIRSLEDRLANARTLFDEKLATIKELQDRLAASERVEAAAADRDAATTLLMSDLNDGFRLIGSANTIAGVLTALVKALSKEFARVALFRVKGNRLEGQEQIGFDSKTDIAKLVMPLGMDSLLSRAVSSGSIERLAGADLEDDGHAPFGGTPTCAIALPVVVHGETLGIVYADNAGPGGEQGTWDHALEAGFAEALLQHSVALLMRLTTELRTLAELRSYAESLLNEMEQMYLSDVNAGRSGQDLQSRLKANLEYARSIYANRISFECPEAATLLDEQLSALAEGQQTTPFGHDLAIVAGQEEAAAGQSRRTAS